MTFNEKREYLKKYKINLNLICRLESKEKFLTLTKDEQSEKEKAKWQTEKLKEEIALMPDPVLREILKEKYISGATFEHLAEDFGYSTRHIQRLHKAAVENFEVL